MVKRSPKASENKDRITAKVEGLPSSPGVYLFKDRSGGIIYIGKAKNLRHRVRSYFQAGRHRDLKSDFLGRNAGDLDYIITDSEVEALILESSLVKKHQPRLNVRLKDDKSFLHIKLTLNEEFPRVLLTRRIRRDGGRYFGPYLPASLARSTVKIINRHFLLRTCSIKVDGSLERPCLEYYIKRCAAPCVEGLCSTTEYARAVQEVILLLEGKNDILIKTLNKKMLEASKKELYETAAFYRDRVDLVRDLAERQKMSSPGQDDQDVFAYYREASRLALQLFSMRGGRVVGKREFYWEDLEFFEPVSFLKAAVQQYYLGQTYVPEKILLPSEIEDRQIIEHWLNELRKSVSRKKVRILVPKRGRNLDLLLLVERNAKIAFESRFRVLRADKISVLEKLQQDLGLPYLPKHIEAFDVSNIQSAEPVASMVVNKEGVMSRKDYRKFKIKAASTPNDFAAIQEAVLRRYKRLLKEDQKLPELVIVDGGKGQLHSAYQALSKLGIEDTPLASIAKREEVIYVQGQEEGIDLPRSSRSLHLVQEIRDEAHRFAVTYHRKRRTARDFSSELDAIPGIGPKRKRRLLQNFGSVARIRRAPLEELTPFLGKKLAGVLKEHLETTAAGNG
jgi:excinuclease ABC subunit C